MVSPFHFWGRIAASDEELRRGPSVCTAPRPVWRYRRHNLELCVEGTYAGNAANWFAPEEKPDRVMVFVSGSVYLGSDGMFGQSTAVEPLPMSVAPKRIAELFDAEGTNAFARLDGDFTLVLSDPKASTIYLVVDKLGCDDLYIRREATGVYFSSHVGDLTVGDEPFDPLPLSFLLAHEGFIPAPFTISPNISAVGRSRFAKISYAGGLLSCELKKYWQADARWDLPSVGTTRNRFLALMRDSINLRTAEQTGILLSGGIDSTLMASLVDGNSGRRLMALTGGIGGWAQGQDEIAHSQSIARDFGLPHRSISLDPDDDSLPGEAELCSSSWMNGVRLTLPLWRRFATLLRDELGEGYSVLAGQTADTLADNNYTSKSLGYAVRRAFFSAWFLRGLPFAKALAPRPNTAAFRLVLSCVRSLAGDRISSMLRSLFTGTVSREKFYAGRLFGYGEMPGLAPDYFPMLTGEGFAAVVDWYSANYIKPWVEGLDSEKFYRQLIQMSMDMNMLHLDSRLLFHVYRQEGGRAQLPFMDARVVTFFGSMPYSARALYREPKHVIRYQLRRNVPRYSSGKVRSVAATKKQEQYLLEGTLGAFHRELLRAPTFGARCPRLFEFINERYFNAQLAGFLRGHDNVDHKFIAKLGTLEVWSRAWTRRSQQIDHAGKSVAGGR